MAINKLMTEHEKLEIGVRAAELREAGKVAESRELALSVPMPPWMAKVFKEKVSWGRDFLKNSGWNMAEVEAAYGKDWINN
ncbi:MAG: hypothetical protein LBT01_02425 [Spirochaetaceae bacterium]|nr:hypothetical protein [Spirochaetaceae bacterium]